MATASSTLFAETPGTRVPTGNRTIFVTSSASVSDYNDFAAYPLDVNGDGQTDYLTASYFGKNVGWVENTGKGGGPWLYHELDVPGPSESAAMVDLTGDGISDFLPNAVNVVAWYEVVKKTGGKGFDIKKHDFGTQAAGHGVGSGDVNGDGRIDLLTPKGWFAAPAEPAHETWTWHPDWNLGATGIQILARRRWRWPVRPCLRHGPRLWAALAEARQERQWRANLDQGRD